MSFTEARDIQIDLQTQAAALKVLMQRTEFLVAAKPYAHSRVFNDAIATHLGLEDYGVEGIGDIVSRMIEAIKAFFKRIGELISKGWKAITGASKRQSKQTKDIEKAVKEKAKTDAVPQLPVVEDPEASPKEKKAPPKDMTAQADKDHEQAQATLKRVERNRYLNDAFIKRMDKLYGELARVTPREFDAVLSEIRKERKSFIDELMAENIVTDANLVRTSPTANDGVVKSYQIPPIEHGEFVDVHYNSEGTPSNVQFYKSTQKAVREGLGNMRAATSSELVYIAAQYTRITERRDKIIAHTNHAQLTNMFRKLEVTTQRIERLIKDDEITPEYAKTLLSEVNSINTHLNDFERYVKGTFTTVGQSIANANKTITRLYKNIK